MLMQILQMAPSAQPRIFWQLALVPLTGPGATESMQSLGLKQLPQDQMTAIMRASGGLCPCASGRSLVAELQLVPSTHMKLGA